MNHMKHLTLVLTGICALAFSQVLSAQEMTVRGVVSATTGESVIGAGVMIKGTATGVTTDLDGRYELSAPENATLVFSRIC